MQKGYTTDGGRGFPHLRVSASTIPVGNAIDVWRMCLRVTFSPPKGGCGETPGMWLHVGVRDLGIPHFMHIATHFLAA